MGKRIYKKCLRCKGEIKYRAKNAKYHLTCYREKVKKDKKIYDYKLKMIQGKN
jgi:hypothetical protein